MATRFTRFSLLLSLVVTPFLASAQNSYDIDPDKAYVQNGLEYGMAIRNERKLDQGSKGIFTRYEVALYVSNKSGCTKIMMPRQSVWGQQDQNLLAQFDCLNATGMRLTSKSSTVKAKDFYIPYQSTVKAADGKNVTNTVQVKVGNILHNGETISDEVIFIVPEGETPRVKVRVSDFSEL